MGMAILLPGRTGYGTIPTERVYARRSVSTSQRAVRSSRPSPWRGPTSWTPSGRPLAPLMSGTLSAGTPHSVHSEQKTGSPVDASPGGGGREQRVVALLEQLGESLVQAWNLRERLEVPGGGVAAPALDAPTQPLREARAALV